MNDDRLWEIGVNRLVAEKGIPKAPSHFQWITACPCCGKILSPVDMSNECECGQLLNWGSVNG